MIEEIENLPTYATQEVVIDWFNRVSSAFDKGNINTKELIECLYELADQQYHQYELMPDEDCFKIEMWLLTVLELKNRKEAEVLVPLANNLGFSVKVVHQLAEEVNDDELRNDFIKMLRNIKCDRINPYWDLK